MKNIVLILFLAIGLNFAHAQDDYNDNEVQTIFSKKGENGGYGALTFGYSKIDGHDAFISGARGAFIFNHSFAIGLGGYSFINNLDHDAYTDKNQIEYSLAGGYGGIIFEPIFRGTRPIHLSFPILIGGGGVAIVENYGINHWENHPSNDLDNDLYFVIEPALELEFNFTKWFRTAAFFSYRFTSKIDLYETKESVLRGFNFGLTFKFGKF